MRRAPRILSYFRIPGLAICLVLLLSFHAKSVSASEFNFGDWLERPELDAKTPQRPPMRTAGTFSHSDSAHLSKAFEKAVDSLREFPECRSLFEPFGGEGEELLAKSLYVRAKVQHESRICGRRVAAFTSVGSPVTRLCRNFRRLDAEQGALILIHEALHFAGLSEAPHEPGAPTSQEINATVASSCGL